MEQRGVTRERSHGLALDRSKFFELSNLSGDTARAALEPPARDGSKLDQDRGHV